MLMCAEKQKPSSPTETAIQSRAINVLVVHSDESLRQFLNSLLGRAGYHVRLAGNAVGASMLILEMAPDVMIVDVDQQGMDALKFVAGIRGGKTIPFFPVIFLTENMDVAPRAQELGGECVLKPVRAETLLATVSSCSLIRYPQLRIAQPTPSLAKASDEYFRRASRAQVLQ